MNGDTGFGVGTGERYYLSPSLGQMGLSDVTFVPKDDFQRHSRDQLYRLCRWQYLLPGNH